MPMGLKAGDKTNVTSFLSALDTAINGLDISDRAQVGVKALLVKFRTELNELLKHDRAQ